MAPSTYLYDERLDTRGLVLKRRSEVRPDEMIVAPAPPRNRGQLVRRTSSLDRYDDHGRSNSSSSRGRNMAMQRYRDPHNRDASDSEGSVPPRSRPKGRGQQGASKSQFRNKHSSSSSESLGSSTGDEKNIKKMKRKKYLTYGLASVATIHAVATVHQSVKNRKERREEVETGQISPEEAREKNQQGRWKDAGAVGLSALGLYQVFNETKECWELRKEHAELEEQKEERHMKREEKRRREKSKGRDR